MFSVLISVYKKDNPLFFIQALKSIYEEQTLKPDEIVIVCDGKIGDELKKCINDFSCDKKEIVKCVYLSENKGLGKALDIGRKQCIGDYIFRMDSDDISLPDRFEIQMKFLNDHPDVDVLGGDIAEFHESLDEDMNVRKCPADHDAIVNMMKRRNPMNHVTVAIRRSALESVGGYDDLLLLEDYLLWIKMCGIGYKLANINETLVYVRTGKEGIGYKRGSKARITGWKVLQDNMIKYGFINKFDAAVNMMFIRSFIYSPAFLKNIYYSKLFRKGSKSN